MPVVADEHLAAAAAHQLGEGVVLLRAYTDMVRDAGTAPPGAVKGLEEVSRRLRCLDDALLDVARIERDQGTLATIAPADALARARRLLAEDHQPLLVRAQPDPLPGVQADPVHVERLFVHALREAARSGRRRLNVGATAHGNFVRFRVGDERAGVELDHASAVARRRPVSDVGLAVCRRIVDVYGGELWLDRDRHTLAFTLPAAPS